MRGRGGDGRVRWGFFEGALEWPDMLDTEFWIARIWRLHTRGGPNEEIDDTTRRWLQLSVVLGCFLGLALASFLMRHNPRFGHRGVLDIRGDSWDALMLNVSVIVGALSGLALAYFIMGGRDL
jgi:hypothetical protein